MYKELPSSLKEEVKDEIFLFRNKENHQKLKVHKLHSDMKNFFAFSVNYKIRIVFEHENKKTVNLLYVGGHDEVYN